MTRLKIDDLRAYLDTLAEVGFPPDTPLWALRKLAEIVNEIDVDLTNTIVVLDTELAKSLAELDRRIAALESCERSREPGLPWPH
jgi:hypothetical protein